MVTGEAFSRQLYEYKTPDWFTIIMKLCNNYRVGYTLYHGTKDRIYGKSKQDAKEHLILSFLLLAHNPKWADIDMTGLANAKFSACCWEWNKLRTS